MSNFMKYFLPLFIVLSAFDQSTGQVLVGDIDINGNDKIKIIEVLVTEKFSSKSVNVFVDFGQRTNFSAGRIDSDDRQQAIIDPTTNKAMTFASSAAVLNYLELQGWKHYNSVILRDNRESCFFFYLRRKPSK